MSTRSGTSEVAFDALGAVHGFDHDVTGGGEAIAQDGAQVAWSSTTSMRLLMLNRRRLRRARAAPCGASPAPSLT